MFYVKCWLVIQLIFYLRKEKSYLVVGGASIYS